MRAQQPRHCSNAFDCGTLPIPNRVAAKQLCTELYFPRSALGGRCQVGVWLSVTLNASFAVLGRGKGLFEGLSTCQL